MVVRQALLILDMINYLVHRDGKKAASGYHEHVRGRNVLERTATAIARARAGARRGQAAEGESAVVKRRVSPFHGTHLDLLLRKQRVDTSCSPGWRPTWSFCRLPAMRTITTIGPRSSRTPPRQPTRSCTRPHRRSSNEPRPSPRSRKRCRPSTSAQAGRPLTDGIPPTPSSVPRPSGRAPRRARREGPRTTFSRAPHRPARKRNLAPQPPLLSSVATRRTPPNYPTRSPECPGTQRKHRPVIRNGHRAWPQARTRPASGVILDHLPDELLATGQCGNTAALRERRRATDGVFLHLQGLPNEVGLSA